MAILDFVNFNGARLDLQDSASVHFTEQELTDTQQAQARENIDAGSQTNLSALEAYVRDMSPVATVGPADMVSVDDAAPLTVEGLTVNVEPVQDLHGYDNPWPAGGGKNKFPYATLEGNGNILLKQPVSIQAGAYIVSCVRNTSEGYFSLTFYDLGDSSVGSVTLYLSNNNNVALTLSGDAKSVTCYAAQNMSVSNVQIEAGSTSTEFIPYSNICPITGWDGVTAKDEGKNLIQSTIEKVKSVNTQGTWSGNVYTYRGISFVVSLNNDNSINAVTISGTATADVYFRLDSARSDLPSVTLIANGAPVGSSTATCIFTDAYSGRFNAMNGEDKAFTTNGRTIEPAIKVNREVTVNDMVFKPMIRYASDTDSTFTPYVPPRTASVSFPETIYGGRVDLTTGECVVDRAMVDLGTLNWNTDGVRFVANLPGVTLAATRLKGICSMYPVVDTSVANAPDKSFIFSNTSSAVYVKDSAYSDADSFTAAMSGVQLCYELATPITLTLDPAQLELFKGINNISADAGQVTVTYRQDIYTALNKRINELQALVLES